MQTIIRFIYRARRVECHSLLKDRPTLAQWAEGRFTVTLTPDGTSTIRWPLPTDEEVFESLVARLRPLTLPGESIYYEKVFAAIESSATQPLSHDANRRITRLLDGWRASEVQGSTPRGYSVQMSGGDGSNSTPMVSDTQLAAAWLYGDLVHADAKGPKSDAMVFELDERYSAAVRLFSHLALLTVGTLQLVRELTDAGMIDVDDSVWNQDVVVGKTEIVHQAEAFIAEVGATAPDLGISVEMSNEWRRLDATELRRLRESKVRVGLVSGEEELRSYDATVLERTGDVGLTRWSVLVADSIVYSFEINELEGRVDLRTEVKALTNTSKLRCVKFLADLADVDVVTFGVAGQEIARIKPGVPSAERVESLKIVADALNDLLEIERITGSQFPVCDGDFNELARVRLRWTRLVWQGSVVRTFGQTIKAKAETEFPRAIVMGGSSFEFGGVDVPVPRLCFRHPDMTVKAERRSEGGGWHVELTPPAGERFLTWCPELRDAQTDSELIAPAPWDLRGVDENSFPV